MRRDAFSPQRSTAHAGGRDVLPHRVLDACDAQVDATRAGEDRIGRLASAFAEPRAEERDSLPAQGRAAFLPAFSAAAQVRTASEFDVLDAETGQLGASQSRLDGDHEQRVVAPT